MPYKDQKSVEARERARLRGLRWREKNRERFRETCRAYEKRNRKKRNAKAMERHWANRERELLRMRQRALKRYYGLTLEQYEALGSCCQICGATQFDANGQRRKKQLAVDHNKVTGRIRGLLCGNCNTAIGLFLHDCELMTKAIAYLKQHA